VRKFLMGFVAGVLLTGLATLIYVSGLELPGESAELATRSASTVVPDPDSPPALERASQGDSTATPERVNVALPSEVAAASTDGDESAEAALRAQLETAQARMEEARSAYLGVSAELARLERGSVLSEPIRNPLFLAPEFDWLPDQLRFEHEALQREFRDETWARPAEAQLQSYFRGRPEVFETFGAPTVNCGTTRCEVTFVAYGVDQDRSSVYRTLIADLQAEPDVVPMVAPSVWDANLREDGVTTIFWAFDRKDE